MSLVQHDARLGTFLLPIFHPAILVYLDSSFRYRLCVAFSVLSVLLDT